jgi:riboflavin synthase
MGDELGGHLVYGHVDALGEIVAVKQDGESRRIRIGVPAHLAKFFAEKGSVTVDGVSLTVSAVGALSEPWFEIAIIPHTWSATTLSKLKPGDKVNLEADMMARYGARLIEARS